MDTDSTTLRNLVIEVIGDSNHIHWEGGVARLLAYEPTAVVPVVIEVLLDRGGAIRYWGDVVEGICRFLLVADASYASPCAPALVDVLAHLGDAIAPDPTFLLDVLNEKVDIQEIVYAIPVLLDQIRGHGSDEVSSLAWHLFGKFPPDRTQPYALAVDMVTRRSPP